MIIDLYQDAHAAQRQGLFIAEGPETLLLLLQSNLEICSLCLKRAIFDRLLPHIEARHQRQPPFPVFVCAPTTMASVVGYSIARGALGAGRVPHYDLSWVWRNRLSGEGGQPPLPADPAESGTGAAAALPPELPGGSVSSPQRLRALRVLAVERSSDEANLGRVFGARVLRPEAPLCCCELQRTPAVRSWRTRPSAPAPRRCRQGHDPQRCRIRSRLRAARPGLLQPLVPPRSANLYGPRLFAACRDLRPAGCAALAGSSGRRVVRRGHRPPVERAQDAAAADGARVVFGHGERGHRVEPAVSRRLQRRRPPHPYGARGG